MAEFTPNTYGSFKVSKELLSDYPRATFEQLPSDVWTDYADLAWRFGYEIAGQVLLQYINSGQEPVNIRGFHYYYDHENEGVIVIPPDRSYIKFTKNTWYD
jgi:hypothetical protein